LTDDAINANDTIAGTAGSESINGGNGNDVIYGNGGKDTLIGGAGNDLIYGGSAVDKILAGAGNDTIFGNGGDDFINSGAGFDTVWLGAGAATVVLESGQGYDTIKNFQLGATQLKVGSLDNLTFDDSADGAQIFQSDTLLAVVSWQSASNLSNNARDIFVV
jgi:Ca2+-binding RTX toxin-like protein